MAGETNPVYASKDLGTVSKKQEEGTAGEQFSENDLKDSSEHCPNGTLELRLINSVTKFVDKDRDSTQQREAVIRPQQAGKIDFKSLQNRSNFVSDRTWNGGKTSPQSPSGKSRSRDKGKKSGKSDRSNPQQLYRLSVTNPRSNPTIGIAYPQQKVSPPKKLEANRGPVSGSYRFHVPSNPEREAELQQEELCYNRCFQDGSSNLTSPGYTSQTVSSAAVLPGHKHPTSTQQPQGLGSLESGSTQPANQILFSDFQGLNRTDAVQSQDRTFGTSTCGILSQKSNIVAEPSKASSSFVPMSFQYGFSMLEDTPTETFPCEQNTQSQEYIDMSLPPNHIPQNSFTLKSASEGQDAMHNSGQFSSEQNEDRPPYLLSSQHYLQAPHGMPSATHCPRGIGEQPGMVESSAAGSHQSDKSNSAMPDKTDNYCHQENREAALDSRGKRSCHPKDCTANQRAFIQGNVHHIRNNAQTSNSQMHFPGKAYSISPHSALHMGSGLHDKNMNKGQVPQPWEGQSKVFSQMENPALYPSLSEKNPFQCQPAHEQRQGAGKNCRMPWQQIRLSSATPNQNKIDLSRQMSNQKLTFLIAPTEWQDEGKLHKSVSLKPSSTLQNKQPTEGYMTQRHDTKHNTLPLCTYSNKMEANHVQVCDSKNKSLYFGMNQALPVPLHTRAFNYPQVQHTPVDMMLVSPYESPLPSPIQNPASSSTCSSLSPASTSPVNSSSDDSQKSLPPPFFPQHQDKAPMSSDNLSVNQHHFQVSGVNRNLPYVTDRLKEDHLGFVQNNRHTKSNLDGNKDCLDTFAMEHPPPPYPAHQLLASSLANLDQWDVFLTCKQCDQNFNNLVSFLEHKQYCGHHTFSQNDFKDMPKVDEIKKFQTDPAKVLPPGQPFSQMSRCPSDLHLSLLGLSKNGELIQDSEVKADSKEDNLKLNMFSSSVNPQVPLPDLEMEDAKLDSLITEALNGLGYQSDNAEIDSSFIDAFVDDELTTTKCTSNRQTLKTKESLVFESRSKHETGTNERSVTKGTYPYDSDIDSLSTDSKQTESSHTEALSLEQSDSQSKEESSPENFHTSSLDKNSQKEWIKETRKPGSALEESTDSSRFLLSKKFSEHCGLKSFQESSSFIKSSVSPSSSSNRNSTNQRLIAREGKRKRTGGGTWSKELIHKIVQQKNKLHKLHVKGTKNMQFSLVMERLTPTVQTPTFREYDYVSDSDDDCEPLKIASQGRLSQSIRCKYTYTKECKGRARSIKTSELPWKQDKNECFESKKCEDVTLSPVKERLRRRSSRSSTSSDLSTSVSVSSDSISSPKSTDRDSDNERKIDVKAKDCFEKSGHEMSPHKVRKGTSTSLALSFSKNTKKFSTEKILLSANKEDSTTTRCSSSSRNTEIVSELTKMRSVFSLTRFKSTEVSSLEKEDIYSCETGIVACTEESTSLKKDHRNTAALLSGFSSKLYPSEAIPNKEPSIYCKQTRDESPKKKTAHKRKDHSSSHSAHPLSETSIPDLKLGNALNANREEVNLPRVVSAKPSSLCSGVDESCLSSSNLENSAAQKENIKQSLVSYSLEQDQSLLKSPLSFDTSSMFGDLTVSGFDNSLYPDIQLHKDTFNPMEPTTEKKDMFESSFSPFLEQRDWSLMVDVTPVLPDVISQYKEDSDITNDKKNKYANVPYTLPDQIMDYSTNIGSCVSEDELEIKRIVNELENQLQTAKLNKLSPPRSDNKANDEQNRLEAECPGDGMALTAPTMQTENFSDPDLPWTIPIQFGLVEGQHSLHTPTHSVAHENLNEKEVTEFSSTISARDQLQAGEKTNTETIKSPKMDKSEEMLENEMYAKNLMKSLEVISDSIFRKDSLTLPLKDLQLPQSTVHDNTDLDCKSEPKSSDLKFDTKLQSRTQCLNDEPETVSLKVDKSAEFNKPQSKDMLSTENTTDVSQSKSKGLFDALESQLQVPVETCEHNPTEENFIERKCDTIKSPELLFPTTIPFKEHQVKNIPWPATQPSIDIDSREGAQIPLKESEFFHSSGSDEPKDKKKLSLKDGNLVSWNLAECESAIHNEMVNKVTPKHSPDFDVSHETIKHTNGLCKETETESISSTEQHDLPPKSVHVAHIHNEGKGSNGERSLALTDESPSKIKIKGSQQCPEQSTLVSVSTEDMQVEDHSSSLLICPQSPSLNQPSHEIHSIQSEHSRPEMCCTDGDKPNPDLLQDRKSSRWESCEEPHMNEVIHCESSTAISGMDHTFEPDLEFEMSVDKIPSSVTETSKTSAISETSDLDSASNDFTLRPLNFHDHGSCAFPSAPINKDIVSHPGTGIETCLKTNCDNNSSAAIPLPLNELIFKHGDADQLPTKTNDFPSLRLPNTDPESVSLQTSLQCLCPRFGCLLHKTSVSMNEMHAHNLDLSHDGAEAKDCTHFTGLQNNMETESLKVMSSENCNVSLGESSMVPEDQKIIQAPSVAEPASLLLSQPESVQVLKPNKQNVSKKNATQPIERNFQCEICSMYFRTMPGLKRHKAMKHVIRTNGSSPKTQAASNHITASVYQSPQSTDKEGQTLMNPQTSFHTECTNMSKNGEDPTDPVMFMNPEKGQQSHIALDKEQVYDSWKKEPNNDRGEESDPYSVELLTILETDILHTLSPDFTSLPQQGCSKLPAKNSLELAASTTENGPDHMNMNEGVDQRNENTHPPEIPQSKEASSVVCRDKEVMGEYLFDIKKSTQPMHLEQECIDTDTFSHVIKSDLNYVTNTDPLVKDSSTGPSEMIPDLKDLLDDESTFSQLFPRNEEMKRKKCPRVYGKINKKQKHDAALPLAQDFTDMLPDKKETSQEDKTSKICVNRKTVCEYETTSVEDTVMLDNNSSVEVTSVKDDLVKHPGDSHEKTSESVVKDFTCQASDTSNASEALSASKNNDSAVLESLNTQDNSSAGKSEALSKPCPLQIVHSYSGTSSEQEYLASTLSGIDIQKLDSTFQLPEIQFFEQGKDIPAPVAGKTVTKDEVITESDKPLKKSTERKGRKRLESGLKPKDKQYKCKVCFTWFLTLGELNFHKLSHNPSPPPTCYMCVQRKFSSREQLRDHLKEKHAKNKAGVWTCGMCLKEISDVWMYNEHLREHATQFARKGQTQSSILDMPGCFMQESAVKNFITSIMQHRPSKSVKGDANKSTCKEDKKSTNDSMVPQMKTPEEWENSDSKTKGGESKQGTCSPIEATPKNVEIHPNCKDPSRDCHHCGKQFPKPFKLQRHLVVHSLQKIFLCHKCPVSYQEAKDLKEHLKKEHEELDEPDSKHTTLYTCELCADVMHVIKKSFICSTCNYTFSKKEQFDRHMEKHLAGGNKIFKFRGVFRPSKPSTSRDDAFDLAPVKRRKLTESLENSFDSCVASRACLNFAPSADIPQKANMAEPVQITNDKQSDTNDVNVKTEDVAGDFSNVLEDPKRFHVDSSDQTCLHDTIPKIEQTDTSTDHAGKTNEISTENNSETDSEEGCDVKKEDDDHPKKSAPPLTLPEENSVAENEEESAESVKSIYSIHDTAPEKELIDSDHSSGELFIEPLSNLESADHQGKDTLPPFNLTDQPMDDQQKENPSSMMNNESECTDKSPSFAEKLTGHHNKDKMSSKTSDNQKTGFTLRTAGSAATDLPPVHRGKIGAFTSAATQDKDSVKLQKKRKESKTSHNSQRMSSPATRENLDIDSRAKKKFRPSKCESTRKTDLPCDYTVLSSVKDDIVSNKIVSKPKTGSLSLQLKRGSLDNYATRKNEIVRHMNGDFKGKRLGPGRPVQSPTSKSSVTPVSNSINKSRPKVGVRAVDTHAYRTAESQNNLLSQLFGQKLTSFKIPLRKDTSESIN
ncbi:uncharacterized protein znf469 [Denticeps clupeoides]|uniref:C2H2-type domain-containing protein n=1 Tax=Denticeps clupeoides TaxID=299321 RepID=A0AAY4CZY8_9TELE|nr:zinc finger protein 469 [Denticeps clupeoides]XP_028814280.1 zinc finger protein 469 [Denticeps clupeoides]